MMSTPKLTHFLDDDGDESVVDEHPGAHGHDLGDVLVVDPQRVLATLLLELVVRRDLDLVPCVQC